MEWAIPKSITTTRLVFSTMMFCGFRSAVHHTFGVRRFQRAADLNHDPHFLLQGEWSAVAQQRVKVAASHELHRDELDVVGFAEIENADDVLVRYLTGQDQFLFEAREDLGLIRQFRTNYFKRNHAVHFAVAGLVDSAHAALAQCLNDFVALAKDGAGGQLSKPRCARGMPCRGRTRAAFPRHHSDGCQRIGYEAGGDFFRRQASVAK